MFSRFFINRPIFATVIAVLMVLAGAMTVFTLPIAQYPDITPPTVMVSASYPGADASTVARAIGVPIEEQVNGVDNMLYMSSTSSQGSYSLTITFANGTDVDQAAVDVQNRISMASGQLPAAVTQQGVSVRKQSSNEVLFIALQADDPQYDALYLTNYAQLNLVDPLSRVEGVGGVQAFGGGEYSMRVWLEPEAMRERNITPADVAAAIEAQNLVVSAGSVGTPPDDGHNSFEYTLVVEGQLSDPEEFGDIILRSNNGGILRLKDVARVELGSESYDMVAKVNGKPTALIGIQQLPGANALDVAKGSLAEMKNLSKYLPDGVYYKVVQNSANYVDESINDVLVTFVLTTLIVMVVILIFLQEWRAVIIPMLTIPVSIIATFAVMKLLGFSLNTLTLFGLVLAIAIVVDDAIVVVEDVARLLDEGKLNRREAAIKAMEELTGPVIGEVLVLLSVFIPTAFISGITGELYKQFALTIAVSTAFSGFNALTLTPALCALFLAPRKPTKFFLFKGFNKGYDKVLHVYDRTITKMLGRPRLMLLIFLLVSGLGFWAFVKWPSSYIPEEDMGYFLTSIELPTGASLQRTQAVVDHLADEIMKEVPQVEDVMAVTGFSFMGGGSGTNMGSINVMLKPWKERGKDGSIDKVMKHVQEIASRQQEAIVFCMNPPAIPGLGSSSGLSMQLLDLKGLGTQELTKALDEVVDVASKDSRFSSVTSLFQGTVPQYKLNIDRDKVQLQGLVLSDVFSALSAYMGGDYVNNYVEFDRLFEVNIQASAESRSHIEDVLKLSVRNSSGEMVPFSSFAEIEPVMGVPSVNRYNMYQTASLTASPAKNVSSSEGIEALEEIVSSTLGKDFGYAWTGIAYQETKAHTTISFVFIFAIIMTILVLAAQYESWTDPLAVVLAMPIAVLGTMLGVFFMNQSVSIYTQIGLILLLGMAAKNAILIVEYAMDFRKAGVPIRQAAHDAGVIRFRPIMMTALAFVFGAMPLLFSTGAGANSRIELGTAIVFGMALNAIIGTLFVPNFWEVMQTIQEKYLSHIFVLKRPGSNSNSQTNNPVNLSHASDPTSTTPANTTPGGGETPSDASGFDDTNLPDSV